jgi:hypothetical protein
MAPRKQESPVSAATDPDQIVLEETSYYINSTRGLRQHQVVPGGTL